MVHSIRWLVFCYFNYFLIFGIFLPFWSLWLKNEGLSPEWIGMLLGVGLAARCVGSFVIAQSITKPHRLIEVLRILGGLSLFCAMGFMLSSKPEWLLIVMIGFNFFIGPIAPLNDALAGIWQRQIVMDYGKVRLWGSLAFIVGTTVTGIGVTAKGHHVILYALLCSLTTMILMMFLRPSVLPAQSVSKNTISVTTWNVLLKNKNIVRVLLCCTLLQGAHAAYYGFSAIFWQQAGYSTSAVSHLWSVAVVAEIVAFAISFRIFRNWSVRNLLLLSAMAGVVRWGLLGTTTGAFWLVIAQLLHSVTFAVCHLAAMRFITAQQDSDVMRLQAAYAALAGCGGIAIMTIISGLFFEHFPSGVFWIMVVIVLPVFFLLPHEEG